MNPNAGLRSPRAMAALRAPLPDGVTLEVQATQAPGHARELARVAAESGADRVIAVGGDGTANEVAEGLLGTSAALGLLPVGSGNGLARTLRLPLRPDLALKAAIEGVVRPMDVGLVNGRLFLNVAGIGFDAVVGLAFHEWGARGGRRGLLTYLRLALQRAFGYQPELFSLETDAGRFEGRAFNVTFANGVQFGSGAVLAPGARLDDGLLDVVVIQEAPLLKVLAATPLLFLGRIESFSAYRRFPTSRAVVTGRGPHHRDGEPEPETPRLEVEVRPKALNVVVLESTLSDPSGPFVSDP